MSNIVKLGKAVTESLLSHSKNSEVANELMGGMPEGDEEKFGILIALQDFVLPGSGDSEDEDNDEAIRIEQDQLIPVKASEASSEFCTLEICADNPDDDDLGWNELYEGEVDMLLDPVNTSIMI